MRNLVLSGEQRRTVSLLDDSDESRFVVDLCQALDEGNDSESARYILTDDGLVAEVAGTGDVLWTSNLQTISSGKGWFQITYVDPDLVCLSRTGAIVTVSTTTGEAELVGVFDYGLEAAAWSPDREVLLMVTSSATDDSEDGVKSVLLTMNAEWEVLSEVSIDSFVPSQDRADARIAATWRPDGSFCAISTVDQSDNMRKVRIYKRDTLELHAIGRSEDASGKIERNLGDAGLAWASAGCSQLLAAVQRKGKRTIQVVFFETNGLRHREFVLREAETTSVQGLTWNVDSDLLALTLRQQDGTDKVQLWHRSNYHWYLKQEFRYPNQEVQCTKFDEEKPFKLYVLLRGLNWREYDLVWDPSTTLTSSDTCSAHVVDGCTLNTTPLHKSLIPPPMYKEKINLDFPIRHVTFCLSKALPVAAVVALSDGSLILISEGKGDRKTLAPTSLIKVRWGQSNEVDPMSLRSFLAVGGDRTYLQLVAIACAPTNGQYETLVEVSISLGDPNESVADITNTFTLEDPVLRMVQWSDAFNGALLQLSNGVLLEYEANDSGGSLFPSEAEPLLEPCPWMAAMKNVEPFVEDEHSHRHPRLVVGLSTRSRLYCHDLLLNESVSSFYLSPSHQYLCYVTSGSRGQLRFLPFVEVYNFDPLMGADQNQVLEGYEPRNVERGTRLVAILPSQPTAILQMPRGNLEGVFPRALVLRYVMTKITGGAYGDAFQMMRRQKVDFNLLVDMDPWHFLDCGISELIEQTHVVDHLNLFISCLQDSDITEHRFPIPRWFRRRELQSGNNKEFDFASKINQVCRAARTVMLQAETDEHTSGGRKIVKGHFLLPILSTFAKETPPQLEEALFLIKQNALKGHPVSSKKPPLFAEKAQSSIHYLAFLAEYELLFDTALGMYDYDVARAVARNSQMDPKVYLPLLKRLRSLPTFYGRFEVDLRLKRFEAALVNLVKSGAENEVVDKTSFPGETCATRPEVGNDFDQCMELIDKHQLHRIGLELFKDDATKRRQIMLALGNHLLEAKQAETALAIFTSADPPDKEAAQRAARACGNWRCYFNLMEEEFYKPAKDVTDSLEAKIQVEQRRNRGRQIADEITKEAVTATFLDRRAAFSSAARILLDYADDVVGAVDMLISAEMWSEARRTACLHSRQDLVKKCIDAAVSYAQTTIVDLEDRTARFEQANARYAEVVNIRKKAVAEGGPTVVEEETGSLFSAASNASNTSLRSTTSTSSTGSNVSSVISVKAPSSFMMTGDDELNRHRSKFNKGRKKKKGKKKKGKKMRPGSEEELQNLVSTLRAACVDSDYEQAIAETIEFLVIWQHVDYARDLFSSYSSTRNAIDKAQMERTTTTRNQKLEAERQSRKEGDQHDEMYCLIELPVEKEVDALSCPPIPATLQDFFSFL